MAAAACDHRMAGTVGQKAMAADKRTDGGRSERPEQRTPFAATTGSLKVRAPVGLAPGSPWRQGVRDAIGLREGRRHHCLPYGAAGAREQCAREAAGWGPR